MGDRWDVQAWPAITKQLTQRVEVTIAPKDLKASLAIHSEDRVDYVVTIFGLLWVTDTPILDLFQLDETLLDTKLALILIKLVHIVQEAA